jgi:hypothetical protein
VTVSDFELVGIGCVRGMRRFNVNSKGFLVGPVTKEPWCDGVNQARCLPITQPFNPFCSYVVDPHCLCGFYACFDSKQLCFGGVLTVVEGFGRTIIGEEGFRSEFARINVIVFNRVDRAVRSKLLQTYPSAAAATSLKKALKEFPVGVVMS